MMEGHIVYAIGNPCTVAEYNLPEVIAAAGAYGPVYRFLQASKIPYLSSLPHSTLPYRTRLTTLLITDRLVGQALTNESVALYNILLREQRACWLRHDAWKGRMRRQLRKLKRRYLNKAKRARKSPSMKEWQQVLQAYTKNGHFEEEPSTNAIYNGAWRIPRMEKFANNLTEMNKYIHALETDIDQQDVNEFMLGEEMADKE